MTKPCKVWTGAKSKAGYGHRYYLGKLTGVHRIAFFEAHGWWPPEVMHTCDNPPCYEEEHLIAGTHAKNMADAKAKGRARSAKGSDHPFSKLTWSQVDQIRERHGAGTTQQALADQFGLNPSSISKIIKNKRWVR
jgi:HNH endonuclease